jgi:DNA helicase HerA-like ATPase
MKRTNVVSLLDFLRGSDEQWELPDRDDRTAIVGKTGSGKTMFGVFLMLESRLYKQMPWVIFDYKGDSIIREIPAQIISIADQVPTDPGIYRVHLNPFEDPEQVNQFLRRVWNNGRTGLFFDEAYMLPDRRALDEKSPLRAIYTTGRSREIPVIALTQRPVDVLRYNFTEASHHVVFSLNDKRDRDTVRAYVPQDAFDACFGRGRKLPKYHSFWYDVDRDLYFEMKPGPDMSGLRALFEEAKKITKWR